ncbi:hypothetical protein B9Z65_6661 [Elsinoe australis]|uniref:NAD dependent epimerase/dehydratase n=1 Tax=Elsinoe australis TaxID=40998 RepID=A0A2P8ADW1_9PEZI|nr:hypothetical protein B9Z65_6661 [Elsinoe australis]
MGNAPSNPVPSTPLRVLGIGLSRTGTSSLSAALNILFAGPVYHSGTQIMLGPTTEMTTWTKVLSTIPIPAPHTPEPSPALPLIHDLLDGYVAATDAPLNGLVPQLLELYPDALFVCTVRDPDAWTRSMVGLSHAATMKFLAAVLWPLAYMRPLVPYVKVLERQWLALYGESVPLTRKTYDAHLAWVREVVPRDRLLEFDVRDGWGPLCAKLGLEVPDVEFPRLNDSDAIDHVIRTTFIKALLRWVAILATGGLALGVFWYLDWKREKELVAKRELKKQQ